jgi:hypothetical protein
VDLANSLPMMMEDLQTSCPTQPKTPVSDADRALARSQFAEAERLFAAMPPSDTSLVGQLRAKIGRGSSTLRLPWH